MNPAPRGRFNFSFSYGSVVIRAALIVGIALLIYGPSFHADWIGDDTWYVPKNLLLRDPDVLWKTWFVPGSWVEFYPITETVQVAQWDLFREDTFGYHVTNFALHLISCFGIWHLLSKLGLRLAWLGGLLFAIHPEAVDSVVPASELKNTLSLPFFLVAVCCYLNYENTKSARFYLWTLFFFLVAMLCKITVAPFPLFMLLYVWWKRGRIGWSDLKASLPFFVISVALGFTTMAVGDLYTHSIARDWTPGVSPIGGFPFQLVLLWQTLAFYFTRCAWPFHPMPVYPKWVVDPSNGAQFIPLLVLVAIVAWLWSRHQSWGRHALLGLGFFCCFLFPFLGFHAVSYMHLTWVLDHIVYIPILGLIALLVAGLEDIQAKVAPSLRLCGAGFVALYCASLAMQSNLYAGKFVNAETLDRYALSITPNNKVLHFFLGSALQDKADYPAAIEEFKIALHLDPSDGGSKVASDQRWNVASDDGPIHAQLGDVFRAAQRYPEAIQEYQEAIRLHHQPVEMMVNEATCLIREGKLEDGTTLLTQVVTMDPSCALAQYNLGTALCHQGNLAEGIERYRLAIKLQPDYADAYNNLGVALFAQGHVAAAEDEFIKALKIDPDLAESRGNLARLESRRNGSAYNK